MVATGMSQIKRQRTTAVRLTMSLYVSTDILLAGSRSSGQPKQKWTEEEEQALKRGVKRCT